jgi:hypothetical protein
MPKYIYKPIVEIVEETYKEHTNKDIYDVLGAIDFSMCRLNIVANSEAQATALRKGITDVRMWTLEEVRD